MECSFGGRYSAPYSDFRKPYVTYAARSAAKVITVWPCTYTIQVREIGTDSTHPATLINGYIRKPRMGIFKKR